MKSLTINGEAGSHFIEFMREDYSVVHDSIESIRKHMLEFYDKMPKDLIENTLYSFYQLENLGIVYGQIRFIIEDDGELTYWIRKM